MPISFNQVPANLRAPFVMAEFDNSRAQQGPSLLPYRGILIGQQLKSSAQAADSLARVTSADQVATICGRGSMLHRQAQAWFAGNKTTETWIGILADAAAAAQATGALTFSGTATAAGSIALYIGGRRVVVGVASGDTAATVAANAATVLGKHASGTVTMATPVATTSTVTIGATTFAGAAGAVVPGAATFSVDTGNSQAATSLAAQINAHAVASKLVRATANGAVVTVREIAGGSAGNAIVFTSSGSTVAVSGAGTLTGATSTATDLAVSSSVSGAVTTMYAKNPGAVANEIDLRANLQDGEAMPAGLALVITAMSGGSANPSLANLIAAMGDQWFHILTMAYTDATSLGAMEAELADRFGPLRMIDGSCFTAKSDTYANVATLGEGRNSPHNTILRMLGDTCPSTSEEFAAAVASVVAFYGPIDPARPFQTLPVPYLTPPPVTARDTYTERNLLLFDGIATVVADAANAVRLERLITTYQKNAAGSSDTSYLDVNTMLTLMYLRYSFRNLWSTKYPRHKLAGDADPVPAGQAIMTPKLAKAEAVAWFIQMQQDLGLVEGLDQFKADLIVERNQIDPNRLDFKLSPDLINQLIGAAIQIQFLL